MFCQHSAEATISVVGVRDVTRGCWFVLGFGSPGGRFHCSLYLAVVISVILEYCGEKFQFICKRLLITESTGSVY